MSHPQRPAAVAEDEVCRLLLAARVLSIRDVDAAGEEPFVYSSGHVGPGYVMVKGLVGRLDVFSTLTEQLALKLIDEGVAFDHVAGNATGA